MPRAQAGDTKLQSHYCLTPLVPRDTQNNTMCTLPVVYSMSTICDQTFFPLLTLYIFVWYIGLKKYPKKVTENSKNKQNCVVEFPVIPSCQKIPSSLILNFVEVQTLRLGGNCYKISHSVAFSFIGTKRIEFKPMKNSLSAYVCPYSVHNAINEQPCFQGRRSAALCVCAAFCSLLSSSHLFSPLQQRNVL